METRRFLMVVAALALLLVPATASHAIPSITFYIGDANKAAWQAAAPLGYQTETFDDAVLPPGVSWSSGWSSASISGGELHDRVSDGHPQPYTLWTFDDGIFGLGADWDLLIPGGPGTGLTVFFGAYELSMEIDQTTNGFWGFMSDTPFTMVALYEGSATTAPSGGSVEYETFDMDNMVYAPAVVPEPATLLLLGAGLLGTGFLRRKRS